MGYPTFCYQKAIKDAIIDLSEMDERMAQNATKKYSLLKDHVIKN